MPPGSRVSIAVYGVFFSLLCFALWKGHWCFLGAGGPGTAPGLGARPGGGVILPPEMRFNVHILVPCYKARGPGVQGALPSPELRAPSALNPQTPHTPKPQESLEVVGSRPTLDSVPLHPPNPEAPQTPRMPKPHTRQTPTPNPTPNPTLNPHPKPQESLEVVGATVGAHP